MRRGAKANTSDARRGGMKQPATVTSWDAGRLVRLWVLFGLGGGIHEIVQQGNPNGGGEGQRTLGKGY
jgi:hypothetical protein